MLMSSSKPVAPCLEVVNGNPGRLFQGGVLPGRSGWSLALAGGRSRILEVSNRVLGVVNDLGAADAFVEEFEALAASRLPGGGWSETTCEDTLSLVNTCLAGSNLIRAGAALGRAEFIAAGVGAVSLVAARQDPDGTWTDAGWSTWEATAAALALLADAGRRCRWGAAVAARALAALAGAQGPDGLWPAPSAWEVPYGTGGRLLSAAVRHGGAATAVAQRAAAALVAAQSADGSWGFRQTESTAAVVAALADFADEGGTALGLVAAVARGAAWLDGQVTAAGQWPEFPGGPPGVLPTCAAIAGLARAAGRSARP